MAGGAWFKFYPSDWRADPALRMCSLASRGLWMDMLCLMHEAEPRGSLTVNGRAISNLQLAALVGMPAKDVTACLDELEAAGVFSRDNGIIFSRRMQRDTERAARDKANGKVGGNPALKRGVNPPDKPDGNKPDNRQDKAQNLEARDQKPEGEEGPFQEEVTSDGEVISVPVRVVQGGRR